MYLWMLLRRNRQYFHTNSELPKSLSEIYKHHLLVFKHLEIFINVFETLPINEAGNSNCDCCSVWHLTDRVTKPIIQQKNGNTASCSQMCKSPLFKNVLNYDIVFNCYSISNKPHVLVKISNSTNPTFKLYFISKTSFVSRLVNCIWSVKLVQNYLVKNKIIQTYVNIVGCLFLVLNLKYFLIGLFNIWF